jgi:hypothetical protein
VNTKLLNSMQKMVADVATENGIVLADEFGTRERFAHFVVALTCKVMWDMGYTTQEAIDLTLGDGAYQSIANSVWDAAQASQ